MTPETAEHLLTVNRQFYQTFALQFSLTRRRLQPGVIQILGRLPLQARVLDLGCGNGELLVELLSRGFHGLYAGLDNSSGLLEEARHLLGQAAAQIPAGSDRRLFPRIVFLLADLAEPDWDKALVAALLPLQHSSTAEGSAGDKENPSISPIGTYRFDAVLAFAVLHHIPGDMLRRHLIRKVHSLLKPRGHFIHSNWQFLNSSRLRERIQPWERIGLSEKAVDPGDYLLDWRSGGEGLRYVHHFNEAELTALAADTGFKVVEAFHSDGEQGKLGNYQVWEIV